MPFTKETIEKLVNKIHGPKNKMIQSFLIAYLTDPDQLSDIFVKSDKKAREEYQLFDNTLRPLLTNRALPELQKELCRTLRIVHPSVLVDLLIKQEACSITTGSIAAILETFIHCTGGAPGTDLQRIAEAYQATQASAASTAKPQIPATPKKAAPASMTSPSRITRSASKAAAAADEAPLPQLTRSSSKRAAEAKSAVTLFKASATAAAGTTPSRLTRSASAGKIDTVIEQLKKYRDIIIAGLVRGNLIPERLSSQESKLTTVACAERIKHFDAAFTAVAKQTLAASEQETGCERIKDAFFYALMGFARPQPEGAPALKRQDTGLPVSSLFFYERDDTKKRAFANPVPEENNIRTFLTEHPHLLDFLYTEMPNIKMVAKTYYDAEYTFIQELIWKTGASAYYKPAPDPFTPEDCDTDTETAEEEDDKEDSEETSARPVVKAIRLAPW